MKKLKGFSLVEVLMLFAALTIILAVSAPILTKHIKNVPTKIPHGFYECYRDANGNLHATMYNTFRKIKDSDTDSSLIQDNRCVFTPPEEATVFKITLIGAGTGGYSYGDVEEGWKTPTPTSIYNPSTKSYTPDDDLLRELTNGEMSAVLATKANDTVLYFKSGQAPSGGDGQSVSKTITSTNDFYCTSDNEETQKKIENDTTLKSYQSDYYDGNSSQANMYKLRCKYLGGKPDRKVGGTTLTAEGGKGGEGKYVVIPYTVKTSSQIKGDYQTYLQKVANAADRGYATSYGIWNNTTFKSGSNRNDYKGADASPAVYKMGNSETYKTGKSGSDANGLAAIKWTDPNTGNIYYFTTVSPAEGGKGGTINYNAFKGTWTVIDGEDGQSYDLGNHPLFNLIEKLLDKWTEKLENYVDNTDDFSIEIKIKRKKKTITTGNHGESGKVVNFTRFDMGKNPCYIYPGRGTKAHKETKESLNSTTNHANYVDSILSCSAFTMRASGGLETDQYTEDTYTPDYTDMDSAKDKEFPTDNKVAEKPSYKYPSNWLRYLRGTDASKIEFGKGGDAALLTDKCTWKQGTQTYYSNLNPDKQYTINYNQEYKVRTCRSSDYVGKDGTNNIPAGDGMGGAVFIQW